MSLKFPTFSRRFQTLLSLGGPILYARLTAIKSERESSVRNLLEKVGNLRDIAVLVQLNLALLTFTDLHLHSQIVSDYHPLFFNGVFEVKKL